MNIDNKIRSNISSAFKILYNYDVNKENIQIQSTPNEFKGYFTVVLFQFAKILKKKPDDIGKNIGNYLINNTTFIEEFNVVKGFLNIDINKESWVSFFHSIYSEENWGYNKSNNKEVMIEFSSPNTNKPLHLGHLRNIFLGYSVSKILEASGYKVHKVQIINDRGIHICKSMIAWKKFGNGETPKSSGLKGDHLVGKYYVLFQKKFKSEVETLLKKGLTIEEAEKNSSIFKEAQELLIKWENKDSETLKLWKMMNEWVYDGFSRTYDNLGVSFDKIYYESDTYIHGKKEVIKGLKSNIFYKKSDGSIWIDLAKKGFDKKLLIRKDGTSVYMTQDIGTAILRFKDFPKIESQIYTVGNEQEYHFKVLFKILEVLGFSWAKECFHLSYGMIDLPSGKMKSREGKVVDADSLLEEMIDMSESRTKELGKIEDFNKQELNMLYNTIALSAIKFFLLKTDPKKNMLFDPEESIDFQGSTGPFVQYTYARITSILSRAKKLKININLTIPFEFNNINEFEKKIIYAISIFPDKVMMASKEYSPSIIANYVYDLSKVYNRFYQEVSIFNDKKNETKVFRAALSNMVYRIIYSSMDMLGIKMTQKM